MAIISDSMLRRLWLDCYRKGQGKEELRSLGLAAADVRAIFQALEDRWENSRTQTKNVMDQAAGQELTVDQARVLARAWLANKALRGNL